MTDRPNIEALHQRAYRVVRSAIAKGLLVRPSTCQTCGVTPSQTTDGRSAIQAHHPDYNKPLEVEWICARCHRKETPLPKEMGTSIPGELNGQSKFTEVDVLSARRLRQKGLTYRAIAERFGVCRSTAARAVKGELWAHVDSGSTGDHHG